MSNSDPSPADAGRDEMMSGLFARLVLQQTNLTLMLLGETPHPETGKSVRDIEGARLLIDQLEMIEFKTRGNLNSQEEKLLKQSLTALRMAFVEAIDREPTGASPAAPETATPREASGESDAAKTPSETAEERRTKFSKSY